MSIKTSFRRATGTTIGVVGIILWVAAGLFCFIWTLHVLFSVFGVWTIFVGLLLAPVTYLASIFIVWFSVGAFPWTMLIPYAISFLGMSIVLIGSKVRGDD